MAFDAGFVAAVVHELNRELVGARIEKVQQPDRDAVILQLHPDREGGDRATSRRLLMDAGSNNPRIGFTTRPFENPKTPPMFCMLLRKHLTGARVVAVRQLGFERAVEIALDARDEMGFSCTKYLVCETMGRCSNLIFLGADRRIVSALKTVDFSTSRLRQILPGVVYELPPLQPGKVTPIDADREHFLAAYEADRGAERPDKFLMAHYLGISPLLAREVVCRAEDKSGEALYEAFSAIYGAVGRGEFTPVLVEDAKGTPIEYSFTPITQYGDGATCRTMADFSTLTDVYFGSRTRMEHVKQRASDIQWILSSAENRLKKKIALQEEDLRKSADREQDKRMGDLITASMYLISRGMKQAELVDYSLPDMPTVTVPLDSRLTPAQNAQRYYKRYAKAKSAEYHLTKQLALAREELDYVETVSDALSRADSESDLEEIRRELYESGYASRMKGYTARRAPQPKPLTFVSPSGYRILCGKNNSQNDYITHKVAAKGDLWFHVHGMPGSHVVLLCNGEEPSAEDYTCAAVIAATHSKASRGAKVQVDYTRIKNVKKPPAQRPGYVTYSTNYSATVEPDEKAVEGWKA